MPNENDKKTIPASKTSPKKAADPAAANQNQSTNVQTDADKEAAKAAARLAARQAIAAAKAAAENEKIHREAKEKAAAEREKLAAEREKLGAEREKLAAEREKLGAEREEAARKRLALENASKESQARADHYHTIGVKSLACATEIAAQEGKKISERDKNRKKTFQQRATSTLEIH